MKSSSVTSFRGSQTGDRQKITDTDKAKAKPAKSDSDDKLAALKLYRRKNGLCFKCGEKWGSGHKCPNHISIHVLEELLEAVDDTDGDTVGP